MQTDTQAFCQRALQLRLDDAGYDWSAEMEQPDVHWLRWAIVRDAATLLEGLRLPIFRDLHAQTRRPGSMPVVLFDAVERHFLKLALVVATQRLVRLPEFGPQWNGRQARRMEIRSQIATLERAGQKDAADTLRKQLPVALRRAEIEERRIRKEDHSPRPVGAPPSLVTEPLAGGTHRP